MLYNCYFVLKLFIIKLISDLASKIVCDKLDLLIDVNLKNDPSGDKEDPDTQELSRVLHLLCVELSHKVLFHRRVWVGHGVVTTLFFLLY
jgi:hypothetical protein